MGCGYSEYAFPDGGAPNIFLFHSSMLKYVLPNGMRVQVCDRICWCRQCGRFTLGETIPTLEELEAEIAAWQDPDDDRRRLMQFIGQTAESLVVECHQRIQWLRLRRAPPKCLECGHEEIDVIHDDRDFRHPKTGERIVLAGRGFTDSPSWEADFTPDGVKIATKEAD